MPDKPAYEWSHPGFVESSSRVLPNGDWTYWTTSQYLLPVFEQNSRAHWRFAWRVILRDAGNPDVVVLFLWVNQRDFEIGSAVACLHHWFVFLIDRCQCWSNCLQRKIQYLDRKTLVEISTFEYRFFQGGLPSQCCVARGQSLFDAVQGYRPPVDIRVCRINCLRDWSLLNIFVIRVDLYEIEGPFVFR